MSEEKKQADDKKYTQISREFVKHCGEAIGLPSLPTEIAALLAEDVNYRLREAVQNAGQFMRHCKRKKLTNEDFNKALRWNDVEPIYGYSSTDPLPFHYSKEAEVFCTDDHEINLVLMANARHAFEHPGFPAIRAQWLAVEGVQKGSPASISGKKNNGVVVLSVSDDLMSYYNHVTKAILGNNEEVTKTALNDLRNNSKIAPLLPFFINFVSVGVKKVSHDLNQLTKLLHTVRSLTNNPFLYLGPRPFLKLLVQGVLYCIVEPLAASLNPINDHWALRDYAARLLAHIVRIWHTPVNQLYDQTLLALQEVFTDLTKPFCSHYGAVIAMMTLGIEPVRKCLYPNLGRYWPHLMTTLEDTSISNVPFKADAHKVYGALLLASEFFILHLHCELVTNVPCSVKEEKMDEETCNRNVQDPPGLQHDIPKLKEEKPDVSGVVAAPKEPEFNRPESGIKRIPLEEPVTLGGSATAGLPKTAAANVPDLKLYSDEKVYEQLYEYFGDALAARLPFVSIDGYYRPPSTPLLNLFVTPELMQSGEELLEAFNVKVEEEVQSNSLEDDRYSYDDNSLMSDDGEAEPEPADVDLRIKSTVSDPIQGIKLTITKLPRTPVAEPQAKVTKLSIKISKEQLQPAPPPREPTPPLQPPPLAPAPEVDVGPFEVVIFKPPCMFIDLNFDGSMPIPSHKLKRKHPGGHPYYKKVDKMEVYRVGLRMCKVGKAPRLKVNPRCKFVRTFRTGCLLAMI